MYYNSYYSFDENKVYIFDDKKGLKKLSYKPYCYKPSETDTGIKNLFGHFVEKIDKRDADKNNSFEYDISPEMRYLIDLYYKKEDEIAQNKIMFYDIETSSKGGFPNILKADREVLSIATKCDGKYVIFVLDKNGKFKTPNDNKKYIVYNDEKTLLVKFLKYIELIKPTIMSGWNSFAFDFPYLFRRIDREIGIEYAKSFSPVNIVEEKEIGINHRNESYKGYKIVGINQLDYMLLYKKYSINDRSSYALDYISQEELGEGKLEYTGSLDTLYEEDITKFIEYNIQDIDLLEKLENRLHYIQIAIGMSHKGFINYEDVFQQSKIIEGAILAYLKHRNIVAINKPDVESERFPGAFVKEPVAGLYNWIYTLDVQSLYPNLMRTLNISTETKVGIVQNYLTKNIEEYTIKFVTGKTIQMSREKFNDFITQKNISVSSIGVLYRNDKVGVFADILEKWFNERLEYKKKQKEYRQLKDDVKEKEYDVKQYIIKILLNSFYGSTGLKSFRFYDRDNAWSVTSTGQEVIKYASLMTEEYYKQQGVEYKDVVKYNDTDSVIISALSFFKEGQSYDEKFQISKDVSKNVTKYLNDKLVDFSKNILNAKTNYLKFNAEAICESALFVKKKKYALYLSELEGVIKTDEDKLKVKGLDVVKSDFPVAFKGILKEVLIDILENKSELYVKEKLLTFKNNLDNLDIVDIAIPKGVHNIGKYFNTKTKTIEKGAPIHVKSAINYNLFLERYNLTNKYRKIVSGEKLKFIQLFKNEFNFDTIAFKDNMIPNELLEFIKKYIDRDAIFNSVLYNKLTFFYEILGWGKLSLVEEKLSKYF